MTNAKPVPVEPGTIVIFSDLTCPFAHIAMHRLFTARERLGLEGRVRFVHRCFPIELLNAIPGTRHGSDSEIPALGHLEPDAGWQLWQGADYHYPNTVLLAFEAVQAAQAQSLDAGEPYDRALRRAFWAESRPIQSYDELLTIARTIGSIDIERFEQDLRRGTHRQRIFDDLDTVRSGAVKLSPHLFLRDGTDCANPGLAVRWHGEWAKGFPIVERDEPTIYEQLLERAASS